MINANRDCPICGKVIVHTTSDAISKLPTVFALIPSKDKKTILIRDEFVEIVLATAHKIRCARVEMQTFIANDDDKIIRDFAEKRAAKCLEIVNASKETFISQRKRQREDAHERTRRDILQLEELEKEVWSLMDNPLPSRESAQKIKEDFAIRLGNITALKGEYDDLPVDAPLQMDQQIVDVMNRCAFSIKDSLVKPRNRLVYRAKTSKFIWVSPTSIIVGGETVLPILSSSCLLCIIPYRDRFIVAQKKSSGEVCLSHGDIISSGEFISLSKIELNCDGYLSMAADEHRGLLYVYTKMGFLYVYYLDNSIIVKRFIIPNGDAKSRDCVYISVGLNGYVFIPYITEGCIRAIEYTHCIDTVLVQGGYTKPYSIAFNGSECAVGFQNGLCQTFTVSDNPIRFTPKK